MARSHYRALTLAVVLALAVALASSLSASITSTLARPMHVRVSGKEWLSLVTSGTVTTVGSVVITRGSGWTGKDEISDPRVSGKGTWAMTTVEYSNGRADFWGTRTLRNAGGSWKGTWFGFRNTNGRHYVAGTLVGAGAYKGLVYRVVVTEPAASGTQITHTFDLNGWIETAGLHSPASETLAAPMHVRVTAKSWASQLADAVTQKSEDAEHSTRPSIWGGTEKASEPGVTGRYRVTVWSVEYADSRMDFWGTYSLANARGAWKGPWFGFRDVKGRHYNFVTATGTGAYKGLAYRYVATEPAASGAKVTHSWEIDGWIKKAS